MQEYTINSKHVIIADSVPELADVTVSLMVQKMKASSLLATFNILLSTEPGCERIYKRLIKSYQKGEISFHKISAFLSEENIQLIDGQMQALGSTHPMSRASYMQGIFFKEVDFKEGNIFSPTSENATKQGTYDQYIASRGGINIGLCILGHDGRIAFNTPGTNRDSRTRFVRIAPETREDFGDTSKGREALSVGIKTLLDCQELFCIAHGKARANTVNRVLRESVSPAIPASFLREHGNITFVIDKNAATGLGSLSNLGE